ncbi:deoxyribodipyrimidine photo-lyase, partial [bacterium]|nr:deoxyribodipyrimidine photo-lyase [bacterium]
QSKTYDPTGTFIRRYCPELDALNPDQIHFPSGAKHLPPSFKIGRDYPNPIVDYATQRKKALDLFSPAK